MDTPLDSANKRKQRAEIRQMYNTCNEDMVLFRHRYTKYITPTGNGTGQSYIPRSHMAVNGRDIPLPGVCSWNPHSISMSGSATLFWSCYNKSAAGADLSFRVDCEFDPLRTWNVISRYVQNSPRNFNKEAYAAQKEVNDISGMLHGLSDHDASLMEKQLGLPAAQAKVMPPCLPSARSPRRSQLLASLLVAHPYFI